MPGSELVQSVVRAAQIVQLAGQSPSGLGVGDIAARLGLKPPTVHHLLRTLVHTGMLEKVTNPIRYRIGPMIRQIASSSTGRELHPAASVVMREMHGAMPMANIILAEYVNGEVTPTLRMSADQPGVVQRAGLHALSAYSSASGLMFQAVWPEANLEAYRQRYPFAEFNNNWANMDELDAWLADARRHGQSVRPSEKDTRLAVAAPVCDDTGQMIATIGGSLDFKDKPVPPAAREALIDLVKKASRQISKMLAGPVLSGPVISTAASTSKKQMAR